MFIDKKTECIIRGFEKISTDEYSFAIQRKMYKIH